MRESSLKIGAKSKSSRPQFEAKYNRPENVADVMQLCDAPAALVRQVRDLLNSANYNSEAEAKLANRGLTIFLQDRIGRPMFEAGDSQEAIQEAVQNAVYGKTKGVSRKQQKIVAIPAGQKSFSAAEVQQMLAKQGITVVSTQQ